MDAFSSTFVGNTWHHPSGYPAYPTPPDTQFSFDNLDLTSMFAGDPNNIIQPDSWFFERWLDGSGVAQTHLIASQESTAAACPEFDILSHLHLVQEGHSRAVSKDQVHSTENLVSKGRKRAKLRPSKTETGSKQGHRRDSTQDSTSQVRERNRNISRRYRDRRQQEAETLEASWERLQEKNAALKTCYNGLRKEILGLQGLLLQHTGCNCTMIHAFIATHAERSLHNLVSPNS
ncbi:hypothetical protein FACUT_10 [Fusarium acutatum]|uniref:BZIP domain-containing protein n=1 Tax=Fusarium acutatum TaxID=78861 RepID=A0A8H4NRV2_9HYPO|nr:hypothetical protein FACUT_10 [Fusarium acutatum]